MASLLVPFLAFAQSTITNFQDLNGPAIIGYWGCNPGGHKSTLPQLQTALQKGYNVIVYAFYDVDANGQIYPDPDAVPAPKKASIPSGGKRFIYLLSLFGGQNGAAPSLLLPPAKWAENMYNSFLKLHNDLGVDGIDIDLENAWGTTGDQVDCGIRLFFSLLKRGNFVVSIAPQTTAVTPEVSVYVTGSWNSYVPLADTSIMQYVDFVAVQLYNNFVPGNNVEKYAAALTQGFRVGGCPACANISCSVKIAPPKIAFGFPAGNGAAPSGCPGLPGGCPYGAALANLYNKSPLLLSTGGLMTWAVEWDEASNWQFVQAATTIKFKQLGTSDE